MPSFAALLVLASLQTEPLAGHSVHGEAFNEGPRQAAYLREGMGRIVFPVTTAVPEAQKFVTQGVGQLHGFYYFEAERSFRQAAALDPDLAMAYWGMAMANVNNEKRAKVFIEKAVKLRELAGPRDRKWIDLLSSYYKESDKERRARGYVKALEGLVHDDPADLEAKAFLAWACWHFKDKGLPIQSHQAVDAILAEIFAREPLHPAHHYRIHLWDEEKKERAAGSAELFGPSQPGIAHAWHMPGHIYSKLLRYADAAWQQEASARVDHTSMIFDRTMPYQIHNYSHNNQWLAQSLGHIGQARKGIAVAENLTEIPRHPAHNKIDSGSSCAREGRSRLFEILSRWELWDELIARRDTSLAKLENPEDSIKRYRLLGTAYLLRGEAERGREILARLEELETKENERKPDEKADEKARKEFEKDREKKLKPLRSALAELRAQQALVRGDSKAALDLLAKAEDLDKPALARAYLRAGDLEKAEKKAKEAVDGARNQVPPLATYVEILFAAGKKAEAAEQFRKLQEIAQEAEPDLPALKRLESLAGPIRLPSWTKKTTATPGGPTLDSLGPLTWRPSPAPLFELADARGVRHRLAPAPGKPALVLFYLGSRCTHCVEQLGKFTEAASGFGKEGITLLAVSTETPQEMAKHSTTYPFPLLSNPDLRVFKEFRCFDDFEKIPLHGTFLIDAPAAGAARIRWQEISYTPFMEARWLLEESRRLLSLVRP